MNDVISGGMGNGTPLPVAFCLIYIKTTGKRVRLPMPPNFYSDFGLIVTARASFQFLCSSV